MTTLTAETNLSELKQMMAELRADISGLSAGDRKALPKLIEAARVIDDIFLTQSWSRNHELFAKLRKDSTPLDN